MGEADRDEVYHISRTGELSIPYRLIFDVALSDAARTDRQGENPDGTYHHVRCLESDRWMLMLVMGDGRSRFVLYDKKTGARHVAVSSKAEGALPVARFNPDDFIRGENDPYFYDRRRQADVPENRKPGNGPAGNHRVSGAG